MYCAARWAWPQTCKQIILLLIPTIVALLSDSIEASPVDAKARESLDKSHAAAVSNATVDPCSNFCRFTHTTSQATDLRRNLVFARATELFDDIFLDKIKSPDDPKFLTSIQNLYKACVKKDFADIMNGESLNEFLTLLGGWPVIEGDWWFAEAVSWRELQIKLSKMGFEGFIKTYYSDEDNSMVLVPASNMFLGSSNDSSERDLKSHVVGTVEFMGANDDVAMREIQKAVNLEINLTQVAFHNNDDLSYQVDLRNLESIFNTSTKEVMHFFPLHFNLSRDRLQLAEKKLYKLRDILDNAPIKDVFNYALARLVVNLTAYSGDPLKKMVQCNNFIAARFPEAREILFVRKYLHKNTKKSIEELIHLVKEKVEVEAAKLNRKPEMVRNRAYVDVPHIDSFSPSLGYPDEFFDDQLIDDYFENLEIHSGNFYDGLFDYIRFKLAKPKVPSFDFWESLRAYVLPHKNILSDRYISAVQIYTYFDEYTPKYMLYGELVSLIAKTITRSVTIKNRMHNNFIQTPQFKYHIKRSLERRIAEWPTQIAYSLYSDWLDNHGPEPTPPELQNYTNRQIFWIHRSHLECHHENSSNQRWANNCGLRRDFKCTGLH